MYESALMIELDASGLKALQQVPLSVGYAGRVVGGPVDQFWQELTIKRKFREYRNTRDNEV